eukprot:CAMPEP_0118915994 /NCGR_PEP_ID=MMETSP1166-20130328/16094_1 /TAXON_ID=1104430 /ORGANISM="Chrysoreinhardia sp, Strain CCMP3193" /LENGTH=67 /DNA_ID=CAMNT_0006855781 /DNA_START=418 /DNA_END=618 /DNA_ORIENTATION=-
MPLAISRRESALKSTTARVESTIGRDRGAKDDNDAGLIAVFVAASGAKPVATLLAHSKTMQQRRNIF